jgi:hypothetical protein
MAKKHDIVDRHGLKVGELRKQNELLGEKYDVHDRYGSKIGEAVPVPTIPSSVYLVIGIVFVIGLALSFIFNTITGITDSIGRNVPWIILYSAMIAYLWVWRYRSSHGKSTPFLRTTVAIIGLVFIGTSQQVFPLLRPYLEHIPNILIILGCIWFGLPLAILIIAFIDTKRFRSRSN